MKRFLLALVVIAGCGDDDGMTNPDAGADGAVDALVDSTTDTVMSDTMNDTGTDAPGGPFTVGGTIEGLTGPTTLQLNDGDDLAIDADGSFTFATPIDDGTSYTVSVLEHPSGSAAHCSVGNASGTITGANVTDVIIECATMARYPVNGLNWGDWVASMAAGADSPCDPDDAGAGCTDCFDGGEARQIRVPGQTSCDNLSATDDLRFFSWTCFEEDGGIVFVSSDPVGSIRMLIDTPERGFLDNFITVLDDTDGSMVYTSDAIEWWDNPIADASGGLASGAAADGTLYIVESASSQDFILDGVSGVSLLFGSVDINGLSASSIVDANNADFIRVEGGMWNVSRVRAINFRNVRCSSATDMTIDGGVVGIEIAGASHSNTVARVSMDTISNTCLSLVGPGGSPMRGNHVEELTLDNCGRAVDVTQADGFTMDEVACDASTNTAIRVRNSTGVVLTELAATNGAGAGFELRSIDSVADLTATDNGGEGATISGTDCTVSDIVSSDNGGRGIRFQPAVRCAISNLRSFDNSDDGVTVENNSDAASLTGVLSYNNDGNGVAVDGINTVDVSIYNATSALNTDDGFTITAAHTLVQDARAYSNGRHGFDVRGGNSLVAHILSANNGDTTPSPPSREQFGVRVINGNNSGVHHATLANSWTAGIAMADMGVSTVFNVASINGDIGLSYLRGSGHIAGNIAITDSTTAEVNLNATSVSFRGHIRLGDAGCLSNRPDDGLVAGTCMVEEPPSAITSIQSLLSALPAFVGKISMDDATSTFDTAGLAPRGPDLDWTLLDHSSRAWGVEVVPGFPMPENRGECTGNCRIWDFGLRNGDTTFRRMDVPTGNDIWIKVWDVPGAADTADCEAAITGSTFVGGSCQTVFLINAIEEYGDGIGNDNSMCESGETCLHAPNFAQYQGHGGMADVAFTDGTLTGITLRAFTLNGYP